MPQQRTGRARKSKYGIGEPYPESVRLAAAGRSAAAVKRRHPSTCDPSYTPDELEWLKAIEDYRRVNARPFPTWTEALGVLRTLGYAKPPAAAGVA